jgi:ankyrin repeat protein
VQVRKLLALGADVNFKNELLQTPLLLAAETGHLETLRALVGALIPYVCLFVCAYMHTLPRFCDMRERAGGAKGKKSCVF